MLHVTVLVAVICAVRCTDTVPLPPVFPLPPVVPPVPEIKPDLVGSNCSPIICPCNKYLPPANGTCQTLDHCLLCPPVSCEKATGCKSPASPERAHPAAVFPLIVPQLSEKCYLILAEVPNKCPICQGKCETEPPLDTSKSPISFPVPQVVPIPMPIPRIF